MRIFLWEIREEQGYSLRNLEKYTGISHMHIYDIERGLVIVSCCPRVIRKS